MTTPLGDLPPHEMRDALHRMADWVAEYRETIASRRIVPDIVPGAVTAGLADAIPDAGEPLSSILRDLDDVIMPGIVHWGHPAFLGYFGSTSNGPALLGEIAAAALNVSAMTWRTSPAATELEATVLRWIAALVGLPPAFTGVVYDTASVAVLHALAAARERALPGVRGEGLGGQPVMRVYASDQAHSSLEKAAIVLGIGERNVVRVPVDARFRMDVAALRATMARDVAAGMVPLAVVATLGTTTCAAVDPTREIAAACAERSVWLHVDAAYGGAVGALPERRALLDGVALADSFVLNPHKWLFVPLDFSTLYLRDASQLKRVFSLVPEYLRGDAGAGGAVDYMDYGIQLGRRFRALKAWMVLRSFGRAGIVSRLREHCRLAEWLGARIAATPDWVLPAPVSMSIVCFRHEPRGLSPAECDAHNAAVVAAVNASGTGYLTHSTLGGRTVMRVGFGNVLTEERHAEAVWQQVLEEANLALERR